MAQSPTLPPLDIWLLVRAHPYGAIGTTAALADALTATYGSRFAVWHTSELLLGVQDGRLFLRTLGGQEVPAPKVVCVRQTPGSMHHDREVTLLRHLERMGATLINPLEAHLTCRNKVWQLQELALAGLPVPDSLSYTTSPLDGVVRTPGLDTPCVVKSANGHGGKQVFLAPDLTMLRDVAGSLAEEVPVVFQQYVAPSHGRDLRVVVVDGEAVAAELRTARDGALASNLARGGTATLCRGRYPEAEALAVRAAQSLGLTIAGVDLLFSATGEHTVCEVNAVPGWRPGMTTVIPAIIDCIDHRLDAYRLAEGPNDPALQRSSPTLRT
ncbi:ATP-grasp domain-containing protein [Streptomyces sp. GS7]|uniref:ATP-grasp domain-containing protein n=1 Tax=Streptomyces sp. GS7 TaxID=2692234 RepID=UPI001317C616|nr:RimK family alpha-L-glutamate ligase [Streptomyces sp. GS7]QHC22660.1 RimK family alpha-L-glutamate ligase [Streptomyces sp. GS7]